MSFRSTLSKGLIIAILAQFFVFPLTAKADNSILAPAVPVDKGVQEPSGDYVREFTGDWDYSYPFTLPQGRNGFSPSLSLSYSSADKTTRSYVGAEWSLSLPKIERFSRTGIETLYTGNQFTSPFAGGDQELIVDSVDASGFGTYLSKVVGGKVKHEFQTNNTWKVTTADGKVYLFGESAVSRIQSADGTKVHTWFLTSTTDTNGNTIQYQYIKSSQGMVYPSRILYGSSTTPYEVRFEPYYSATPSDISANPTYNRGFPLVEEKQLLSRIDVLDPFSGNKLSYLLTYTTTNGLSFLQQVQKQGVSSAGVITSENPTIFSYQQYDGTRSLPIGALPTLFGQNMGFPYLIWALGDLNGDGWKDLTKRIWFNADSYNTPTDILQKTNLKNGGWGNDQIIGAITLDTKNDGWAQIVPGWSTGYQPPAYLDLTGSGSDQFCKIQYNHNVQMVYCPNNLAYRVLPDIPDGVGNTFFFGDVNGDGLTDVFSIWDRATDRGGTVYINTGSNWVQDSRYDFSLPKYSYPTQTLDSFSDIDVADINGDGLSDIAHSLLYQYHAQYTGALIPSLTVSSKKVLLSTGTSFQDITSSDTIVSSPLFEVSGWDCSNNNGVPFCVGNPPLISTGNHSCFLDTNRDGLTELQTSGCPNYPNLVRYDDLNHDNVWESYSYTIGANGSSVDVSIAPNAVKDLPVLQSMTTPQGGTTMLEYTPATGYVDGSGTTLNPELPMGHLTVSKITTDNGQGSSYSQTLTYTGGKLYRPAETKGVQKREFLGFSSVTKTFSDGAHTDMTFSQGDVSNFFTTKGKLLNEKTYSKTGALLQESQNTYTVTERVTGKSFSSLLTQKIVIEYDGADVNNKRAQASTYQYNADENMTEEKDWGVVTPNSNGTFTDTGADTITKTLNYATNSSSFLYAFPSQETKRDNGGNVIGDKQIFYDNSAFGQVQSGNPTQVLTLVSTGSYLTESTAYNIYGLPTSRTNPRGYSTTYTYDSANLFPISETNAKGQTTSYVYDYLFGTPTRKTDPNGSIEEQTLDRLGRMTQKRVSDPKAPASLAIAEDRSYSNALPLSTTVTQHSGSGIDVVSTTFIDGFARNIQSRSSGSGSQVIVKNFWYDERGNLKKESFPVFSTGQSFGGYTDATGIAYEYDALNRLTKKTTPVGFSTITYSPGKKVVLDESNNKKELFTDIRGNLTSVIDYLGTTPLTTSYQYNVLNQLQKITDASNNTREISTDLLGRVVMDGLWHIPATTGTGMMLAYDANGNVSSKTDAKGQTTNYTYDQLDRPLTESPDISYVYDTAPNGIGRVATFTSSGAVKAFEYDILGRTSKEQKTISGSGYTTLFTIDLLGNTISMTYPDGMVVEYGFNNAGQIATILKDRERVIDGMSYAPTGSVSQIWYADGSNTTNTYDITKNYRLTNRVTTNSGGTKLQDLSYTYDNVGNITALGNAAPNALYTSNTYQYDSLSRLVQATGSGFTQTYAYDPIGNITNKSNVGTYQYASTNPHAVTSAGSTNYTYDLNGNMLTAGTWGYGWDSKNRMTSSTMTGATVLYTYDEGTDRLTKQLVGGSKTVYVNDYTDVIDGAQRKYIYAKGVKLATVTTPHVEAPYVPTNFETWLSSCGLTGTGDWTFAQNCTVAAPTIASGSVVTSSGTLSLQAQFYFSNTGSTINVGSGSHVHVFTNGSLVRSSSATAQGVTLQTVVLPKATGIVYHHADHLGGGSVDTDENGVAIELSDYLPFGEVKTDQTTTSFKNKYKFTGKELDTESGLYYYEARYYNAPLGRFTAVDSWSGDLTDPQSLNKYSYVKNNPLKYVDPTGKFAFLAIPFMYEAMIAMTTAATLAVEYHPLLETNVLGTIQNIETLRDPSASNFERGLAKASLSLGFSTSDLGIIAAKAKQVGSSFVSNIVKNPESIWGKSAEYIQKAFKESGYETTLQQSTKGSKLSEQLRVEGHPQISNIQIHPGKGRHESPYYKISTTTEGKIWVAPENFKADSQMRGKIIRINDKK